MCRCFFRFAGSDSLFAFRPYCSLRCTSQGQSICSPFLYAGRKIPIRSDGTVLISPNAGRKARRLSLNELLLAAQQRDAGKEATQLEAMRDQIVLARTPANPFSPPDVFAAVLATMQTNTYLHRVSWIFDCAILLLAAVVVGSLCHLSRVILVLGAIAFSAAYCLIALAAVSRWLIWLPGACAWCVWLLVLISIVIPPRSRAKRPDAPTIPSSSP